MTDLDKEYGRILDKMRRLCSRREYCTADMYRKASSALAASLSKYPEHVSGDMVSGSGTARWQKVSGTLEKSGSGSENGMPDDATAEKLAARMIASLVEDRYLDDMRYAAAFARDKSSISGWGRLKIRNALAAKGLDRHIVDAALEEIDGASAGSRMEKVLEVKFRSLARQSEAVKSSSASGKNARAGGYGAQEYGYGDSGRRYELKMKMLRFAIGRGYGYEEAAPVIERLLAEDSMS